MTNGFLRPNRDFLLTETPVDPKADVSALLAYIRFNRQTGDLVFHIIEGGIRDITFEEKTQAKSERSRRKMRELLGME